jgi:putative glutathione S-transferase
MVLSQLTIPTWPTKTLDRFRKARRRVLRASSTACLHGTFVAGILSAKRASGAPAIWPSCTLAKCRRGSAVAAAYEKNCRVLFYALDESEKRLTIQRYLFGDRIVQTDWRLFCALVRFDAVYHGHFKCNIRRIVDYPNLDGYLRDLYQQPGIAETVNLGHIKQHYYITHDDINPTQIVPVGPQLDLTRPHGRESLSA